MERPGRARPGIVVDAGEVVISNTANTCSVGNVIGPDAAAITATTVLLVGLEYTIVEVTCFTL
jgi:hypothetical protein